MWIPTLASANKGTITKLVHGCSRYCSRSLGEIAERHQRDMVGVEGRDHYERDEVVDDRHRQEPHAPARAIRCDQREHPSTNAVSVDIAAAHPVHAVAARVERQVEAHRARHGDRRHDGQRGARAAARRRARLASSPTTRKKNVIRPSLTHWRRSIAIAASLNRIESSSPTPSRRSQTTASSRIRARPRSRRAARPRRPSRC